MKKILMILTTAFFLSGCSTSQVQYSQAKQVTLESIFDKSLLNRDTATESIFIVRDSGFVGSACTHLVYVNNKKAFELSQGEGIEIRLPEGEHFLKMETSTAICPDISLSQSTTLKLGQPQTFRIAINSNMQVMFSRTE